MTGKWNHGGKTSQQRGYGRQHVKLRKQLLEQEPLCRLCQAKSPPRVTEATIADHIVSIAKGGAIRSLQNMQPVCEPCHNEKSARDRGYRVKREIGTDGWPVDE